MLKSSLLTDLLSRPSSVEHLNDQEWTCLLGQARASDMLATLADRLSGQKQFLPPRAAAQLQAAWLVFEKQQRDLQRELAFIDQAIGAVRPALLKGAAYLAGAMPMVPGRILGDVDVLVRREQLSWAEKTLITHGWSNHQAGDYDQRYYRKWMHEVPAMVHRERGTLVDLHHHLLPPTSTWHFHPDALGALWQDAENGRFHRLSRPGMILHSAVHLICSGETNHGIRDLWDIRCLLVDSGDLQATTKEVLVLARELKLTDLVYPVILLVDQLLLQHQLRPALESMPLKLGFRGTIVRSIAGHAFQPLHWSSQSLLSRLSGGLFYLFGHLSRMPLRLLIPHLTTKMGFMLQRKKS